MDLIMGHFADTHIEGLNEAELAEFAALLEAPDQDVFSWIIETAEVPVGARGPVLSRLQAFRRTAHAFWSGA
jgi:antitoxin CptB